jgi:hypothetical protein
MKRPEIRHILVALGGISSAITIHNYYLNRNEPKPSEAVQTCETGFENMRRILNEQREFFENNSQFQNNSGIKEKLLTNKINNIDSLLNKVRNGEIINPSTDPDFKAMEELKSVLNELANNSIIYESGPITNEQASLQMKRTLEEYQNFKGNSSNSSNFFSNNNLITEITDYFKDYSE